MQIPWVRLPLLSKHNILVNEILVAPSAILCNALGSPYLYPTHLENAQR